MNATHGRTCVSTTSIWTNCSQTFHFTWNFHNDLATQIFLYRLCDWNIIFTAAALSIQNWNIKKPPLTRSLFSQREGKAVLIQAAIYRYFIMSRILSCYMLCITILAFLSCIVVSVEKFYLKFLEKLPRNRCNLLLFSYLFPSSQAHRFSDC